MPVARYLEHSGGQNNQVNEFMMRPNELLLARNSDLSVVGIVRKSLGYLLRGLRIANNQVTGMAPYVKANGTRCLVATVNGKFLMWDGSAWNDFATAGTTGIYGNAFADPVNNEPVYMDTYMDYLVSVGGPSGNSYIAGVTAADYVYTNAGIMAGSPKGRYIKRWKDLLFLADYNKGNRVNSSDVPANLSGSQPLTWGWQDGVYMSTTSGSPVVTDVNGHFKAYNIKPGDLARLGDTVKVDYYVKTVDSDTQITLTENVPDTAIQTAHYEIGSNWFLVGEDDGDSITGFGENSNRLLIFKTFSLWRYDGNEAIKVADVGTTSQRSVQTIDQITIFANRKGVYVFDGVQATLVSRKMQKWIAAIPDADFTKLTSWVDGNTYNLYIGNVTVDGIAYPNVVLKFDVTQNNFSFDTFTHKVLVACTYVESNAQLYFFGNDTGEIFNLYNGNVHQYLDYTPNPDVTVRTIIPWEVRTRRLDFDAPEAQKTVNRIVVFMDDPGGTIFMVSVDGKPFETLNRLRNNVETIECNVTGRRMEFMLVHANENNRPALEGFCIYWEETGRAK